MQSGYDIDRLFVAQGCTSLLNVLTYIAYAREQRPLSASRDVLLIPGGGTVGEPERIMRDLCSRLAVLGNFTRVISVANLEQLVFRGCISFPEALVRLRRGLGDPSVGQVFVGRNFQLINELVANAFPQAHFSSLGDFFGVHDSDPVENAGYAPGLRKLDELVSVFPVEMREGLFTRYPVREVPLRYLLGTLARASHLVSAEIKRAVPPLNFEKCAMLLLSYETDGGFSKSMEDEVEAYYELVVQNIPKGTVLLTKAHPREVLKQEALATERLQRAGYQCISLRAVRHIPVELLVANLPVNLVASAFSWSCVSLAAAAPVSILVGIGETQLRRHMSEKHLDLFLAWEVARGRLTALAREGKTEKLFFRGGTPSACPLDPVLSPPGAIATRLSAVEEKNGVRSPRLEHLIGATELRLRYFLKRTVRWLHRRRLIPS